MKIVTRTRKQAFLNWIAALESGKYRQTTGQLRRSKRDGNRPDGRIRHSFCCLGVLCDLARKDGGSKWRDDSEDGYDNVEDRLYTSYDDGLPYEIQEFMGMTVDDQTVLIGMNDNDGASFKEIAKYIRKFIMPNALARP